MKKYIENEFDKISKNFLNVKSLSAEIQRLSECCINTIKNGNKILFCGNGGSAADSQHLAAELVGRYKFNRKAINSIALTTDTSIITAVANDFGYEQIFARQVEGIGQEGDLLFGISTSGNSKNVLLAFEQAKKNKLKTVALTGNDGGEMLKVADYKINVPSNITNNIQEMHIAIGHVICDLIEKGVCSHE